MNQIYLINNIITNIVNPNDYYKQILWQLSYYLRCIEGNVNITILFLMFGFNKNIYYSLCNRCHNRCQQCCINKTQKAVLSKIIQYN